MEEIRSSVQRVIIGDFASSILLFDEMFDGWDGTDSTQVSSTLKTLLHVSNSVNGGDFVKIVWEPIHGQNNQSTRRLKNILKDVI